MVRCPSTCHRRDTVGWDGRTVDVFGYDLAALEHWLAGDTQRRRPSLCTIVLDGVLLDGDPAAAQSAHAAARTVLEAGPRVCEPAELLRMRYGVTDVLLDLIGSRDRTSDGFVEVIDELLDRCGGRYLVGRSERG